MRSSAFSSEAKSLPKSNAGRPSRRNLGNIQEKSTPKIFSHSPEQRYNNDGKKIIFQRSLDCLFEPIKYLEYEL